MSGEEMLDLLEYLDEDLIMESAGFGGADRKTRRNMNPKKLVVVLLAAALVLALGVMAVSAAVRHDWDRAILDFMGIRDADTTQLEDGTVLIGESDTCSGRDLLTGEQKEITFIASSSIGDKNAAYIRIDTDYEVPEDFDPETDYFMTEDFDLEVTTNYLQGALDRSSVLESQVENGKLFFLLEISGTKNIDRSKVVLAFENLYYYHDLGMGDKDDAPPKELVFRGSWNLEWKFDYRTVTKKAKMHEKVQVGEAAGYLTTVEITPLGIRIEGRIAFDSWDVPTGKLEAMKIEKITLKDGRAIEITETDSWGTSRGTYGYKFRGYYGVGVLGEPLNPDEVESITTDGKEIKI
ncbi:hypothetical protein ACTNA4_12365 [Bariatricus sp. HCP28S3_A7]|uniref:hypothetical protein n=1 Tax=Bariatricus sp. HCP28S3_A7 TaxID=3438894 RepID=UPI003F8AB842